MISNVLASLVVSLLATQALAAPIQSATPIQPRDVCTSLGTGPLGFNASEIGNHEFKAPKYYLSGDPNGTTKYGNDAVIAMTPNGDEPQQFELFSCKTSEPEHPGAITVYDGYIQTLDGKCVQRDGIYQQSGQLAIANCSFNPSDPTADGSQEQHFQFSIDTYLNYYSVVFLGADVFPSRQANTSFGSGGHFDLSIVQAADNLIVAANYDRDTDSVLDTKNEKMIAQLGNQYVTGT